MSVAVHEAGASRRKNDRIRLVGRGGNLRSSVRRSALGASCSVLLFALGCEPKLVVGTWSESGTQDCQAGEGGAGVDASSKRVTAPVAASWSTGFEDGFCDYRAAAGFCYSDRRASFETVTEPVHAGQFAAAFNVSTSSAFDGLQARCVRQGELPSAAYYSAFLFIPSAPTAANNWNLVHFQGGGAGGALHGLWDVSINIDAEGALHLYVYDFLRAMTRATTRVPEVPVGSWFHLEVYLKRAADATGQFAVYQDGELALELTDLITDDSSYGQWYLGSFALSLTPADSTLYVDDVSISETP
jgi:hypothetical protein